jgi:succinate-acetate transporter protein
MAEGAVSTERDVVEEVMVENEPSSQQHTAEPPLADPTALAFAAVGLPFGVIALNLTGVLSPDVAVVALPLGIVYGTIGLFIAGSVAFRNRDAFGAFTYTSFACFFLSFAVTQVFLATKITALQANGQGQAFGTFVAGWTVIVTYLMILSFRFPRVFTAVLISLWAALVLLAFGFLTGTAEALKAGAWIGVVGSLLSLYASAALLTNTLVGRPVLRL